MSRSPRLRLQSLIQAAAVTLIAASAAHAQQAVQWRVEDGGNGHWYRASVETFASFYAAQQSALAIGGHLVTVTDALENQFVAALAPGDFLLGGFQDLGSPSYMEPGGGWRWVTGEPWGFEAWNQSGSSEPNNGGHPGPEGEHFLQWWRYDDPTRDRWNDAGNDNGTAAWDIRAIVEWSADCNGDGIVDYGQILEGHLADANSNNVPDRCECGAFPTLPSCCLGDLNADRSIDGADLGALLFAWGPAVPQSPADLDGDGQVGGADLGLLLFGWGACPVATPPWATVISWLPDPAVVTDPQLRASILATGLPWRVRDSGTGIEMLLVPPGTFQMGCSPSVQQACAPSESPVHQVTLTRAYYLGRYEVTQAQWVATMGSNPSTWPGAELPVNRVEREIISAFLNATGTRLPTEAEWEWAYRAGTTTAFHGFDGQPGGTNDDALLPSIAWCSANSGGQTRAVGGKPGNGFGLHDMSGNVSEWVQAWWAEYPSTPQVDPTGPTSPPPQGCIVIRGGSWADGASAARSSARSACGAGAITLGFRVARNP